VKGFWLPWTGIHCKRLAPPQLILAVVTLQDCISRGSHAIVALRVRFAKSASLGVLATRGWTRDNANQLLFSTPRLDRIDHDKRPLAGRKEIISWAVRL